MVSKKTSFEFSTNSKIESVNYLKLKYLNNIYSIEEFLKEFPNKYEYDTILENCFILYRGKETSYSEFWNEMLSIYKSLEFSEVYINEILENENTIIINNFNLYRGGRFVHKAEKCIEIARYYLMLSAQYFPTVNNYNWQYGYSPYFYERSNHLLTSIIWYNNCFDYILQIIYLSQKLYSNNNKIGPKSRIETIIKSCDYKVVMKELKRETTNLKYQQLIKVLEVISVSRVEIKELANSIKHRGGLNVNGLEPKKMYKIDLLDDNGEVTFSSRELEEVKELNIDIDAILPKLYEEHNRYVKAIREIVNIIYDHKI